MADFNGAKPIINGALIPKGGYKRETKHRIFVNRSLHMEKIRYFGFDMDYTLAVYKSPQYEELGFELIKQRLVSIGYPRELLSLKYDPSFPVRGLWYDKEYGTLVKTDQFGNILFCIHGFRFLTPSETRRLYPNKFMQFDESRIHVLNTLFHLPEMYMLACLVHYFTHNIEHILSDRGVKNGPVYITYRSIYQDVRSATDWIHYEGDLKQITMENREKYVHLDDRLPIFLDSLRSKGAKTFLLTNSEFGYTDKIMEYILGLPDDQGKIRDWTTYFDYVVVDAKKPLFFKEGTALRAIERRTGKYSFGSCKEQLDTGHFYSGGSCEVFSKLIGARGKDVLYVGDHIFGDILKSKKTVGWRTYLVIPELANEIYVWKKEKSLFDRLQYLDNYLADLYKDMNISSDATPDVGKVQADIRDVAHKMEESYGELGSLFRNGSRLTFFSSQVMRYADLYSFSCLNLTHYPLCYLFRAPCIAMPHESTVSHGDNSQDHFSDVIEDLPGGLCRKTKSTTGKNHETSLYEPGMNASAGWVPRAD